MKILTGLAGAVMLLLSAGFFLWGQSNLTQATYGIAILTAACLFGIWARIFQASSDHSDLMEHLSKMK